MSPLWRKSGLVVLFMGLDKKMNGRLSMVMVLQLSFTIGDGWKILVSKWISFICRACDPRLQYERENNQNELVRHLTQHNCQFWMNCLVFPRIISLEMITRLIGKGPVHHFMTLVGWKRQENSTTFYCWKRKMMKCLKYSSQFQENALRIIWGGFQNTKNHLIRHLVLTSGMRVWGCS